MPFGMVSGVGRRGMGVLDRVHAPQEKGRFRGVLPQLVSIAYLFNRNVGLFDS